MSSPPPPCISSDIPRLRFNFPTPLPIGSTLLLLFTNSSSEKREGDTDTAKKIPLAWVLDSSIIHVFFHLCVHINWCDIWEMWGVSVEKYSRGDNITPPTSHGHRWSHPLSQKNIFSWWFLFLAFVNSCHKQITSYCEFLQPHISISICNILCFETNIISWEFLSPIPQYFLTIYMYL